MALIALLASKKKWRQTFFLTARRPQKKFLLSEIIHRYFVEIKLLPKVKKILIVIGSWNFLLS